MGRAVPSGNAAVSWSTRKRKHAVVYDRGELLSLIARSVIEQDACLEEARITYELTEAEVADCRTMID